MENRERLGSRLGFILLSAGCAIGCGNVWKFPWMAGEYGGGIFVFVYLICLALLGLPIMTMEFALGRASQASSVRMYQKLEKPGQKWHIHGYVAMMGNIALMCFYTVVCGWMIYYFVRFLSGNLEGLSYITANELEGIAGNNPFENMTSNAPVNVIYMLITVALGFGILCFNLQGGLERITKYIMVVLLILMVVLAIHSGTLEKAAEGYKFYLVPDFSKIDGTIIVAAMNQAFFTLSLGIGAMAIFGSYIGKDRSLLGESLNVILLDTAVALMAGLILFPACMSYGIELDGGPSLLFNTMSTVFCSMEGGRWWGTLFFMFMMFAAFSTVIAVFETILASIREMTGWKRPKACLVCGIGIALLSLTTALGYSVLDFHPFASDTVWLDFWDFIVSTNLLPVGSLVFALFCCSKKYGWGWNQFVAEANAGKGLKIKGWMKPVFMYIAPAIVAVLYIYSLITFKWK